MSSNTVLNICICIFPDLKRIIGRGLSECIHTNIHAYIIHMHMYIHLHTCPLCHCRRWQSNGRCVRPPHPAASDRPHRQPERKKHLMKYLTFDLMELHSIKWVILAPHRFRHSVQPSLRSGWIWAGLWLAQS